MDKKSVRRKIYWGLFILFIIGSIAAGGPFPLIDIIIVRPIVNILFVIFNFVHDFGLAIILFTLLVKLLMLPLTYRQLNQTKLIRKIQPMLTEIKKNCRGNKQLESLQTMDLYRRYNVKPFSSVGTLLIQFPIFVALFSAITVIASPKVNDNLSNRAYPLVLQQCSEIRDLEAKQQVYLADLANPDIPPEEKAEYDFHPQLFGVIDLSVEANDLLEGEVSWSVLFILLCAILSSVIQYRMTRQQMPSGKSERSKKFRDLVREAQNGRELDETDIANITTRQMSLMMPIMMFIMMFNFKGALVFYYFLSNVLTLIQQRLILRKVNAEIDETTDRAVLKELRNIQEAEVVENKKTGTKIRRVSAKDLKTAATSEKSSTNAASKGGKGSKKERRK